MRNWSSYSVVGFLETVWFLETLIRKLSQILLNPVVDFFGGIYIHARHADQNLCQSQMYPCCRNFEKVWFLSVFAKCEKICSQNDWTASNIYFLYIKGYLSILPRCPALNHGIFFKIEPTVRLRKSVTLMMRHSCLLEAVRHFHTPSRRIMIGMSQPVTLSQGPRIANFWDTD